MPGTTPIYDLPYQADNDPPDGPALGEDLATAVEAELVRIDDAIGTAPVVERFTTSGTWDKPAGAKWMRVRVQAGGGPGGGAPATGVAEGSCGGGGGAGGYAESVIPAASVAGSVTVTIGAAGVGASGAGGTAAAATSFGGHVTTTGGGAPAVLAAGSDDNWATGGDGGTGTVVTGVGFARRGGDGHFGIRQASDDCRGGQGGESMLGGGQRPSNNPNGAGFAGQDYGGGGSGCSNDASESAQTGPGGGAGIVIVETHFS